MRSIICERCGQERFRKQVMFENGCNRPQNSQFGLIEGLYPRRSPLTLNNLKQFLYKNEPSWNLSIEAISLPVYLLYSKCVCTSLIIQEYVMDKKNFQLKKFITFFTLMNSKKISTRNRSYRIITLILGFCTNNSMCKIT